MIFVLMKLAKEIMFYHFIVAKCMNKDVINKYIAHYEDGEGGRVSIEQFC